MAKHRTVSVWEGIIDIGAFFLFLTSTQEANRQPWLDLGWMCCTYYVWHLAISMSYLNFNVLCRDGGALPMLRMASENFGEIGVHCHVDASIGAFCAWPDSDSTMIRIVVQC